MTDAEKAKSVIEALQTYGYIDSSVLERECPNVSQTYLRYLMHRLKKAGLVTTSPKRYEPSNAWSKAEALKVVGVDDI